VPFVEDATAMFFSVVMGVEGGVNLAWCMFPTMDKRMASTCLGCGGAKGENVCTRLKIVPSKQGTCGVNSHTKRP
jgi:hypothetical protein